MKRIFSLSVLFISILISELAYSQSLHTPYPIIFVHGLNSFEGTWDPTINFLSPFYGGKQIFHAVLNAYVGLRSLDGPDGQLGTNDDDVLFPNFDKDGKPVNQLHNGSLFVVNFDNFWNGDSSNPKIITYSSEPPGPNESASNESGIYKQGYALSKCIQAVLITTKAEKVILVGHSMGGLAIREYLQRQEGGKHKWWYNPNDEINGHRVAKVVTIGTPHLGSDFFNITTRTPDKFPNLKSEAVRDLRYNYNNLIGNAPDKIKDDGVYLYGGHEDQIDIGDYYNKDFNSNATENDNIIGLNSPNIPGNYNILQPMPSNIPYTWIVSIYGDLGDDGLVTQDRQYLYNIGDTLNTHKIHTDEPSDYYSILRGLDEPDSPELAYEIAIDSTIVGFITNQNKSPNTDIDLYKINLTSDGFLTINMTASSGSRVGRISILNSNQTMRVAKGVQEYSYSTDLSSPVPAGTYYIQVRGLADADSYKYPYTLSTKFSQLNLQFPNGNDALKIGSTALIQWNSNNIDNLKIEYSTNGGTDWNSIVASIPASSGNFTWVVPNEPSTNCIIRISDVLNSEVIDQSDAVFSIVSEPQGITTAFLTNITSTSATCGGSITSNSGSSITSRGVCWNSSGNPTVDDNITIDGQGIGDFTSSITGLNTGTKYYIRAYATNSIGTAYGIEKSFTTIGELSNLEYFFDADPGLGKANPIAITSSSEINISTKISLANVSPGLHRLYVRVKDKNRKWSPVYSKPVLITTEQTNTPISKIEYFLDEKPSTGAGTPINFTASKDVSVSKNLSLANVSPGLHRIYFKAQDELGRWSALQSNPLLVTNEKATAPITKIEYFLDEPSPNVGTKALSFSLSNDVAVTQNISLTNISPGLHRIYFKAQDETGRWSAVHSKPLLINNISMIPPSISRLEYFIDKDPGINSGISIPFTSGTDVSVNSNIPLDTIPLGSHNIYFRAKDSKGIWSLPQFSSFTIEKSSAEFIFNTGWNIFSSSIIPANLNLKDIFQPLIDAGKLKKVMDEAGKTIENFGAYGGWKNNIGNLNITKGYKVNVLSTSTLSLEGSPVQLPLDIILATGWNIISYPSATAQDAKALFQTLIDAGKLKKVMDEAGKTIENFGAFGGWKNNIGNFLPGKGYKVNVTGNCTLTIPASGTKSAVVVPEVLASTHFAKVYAGNGTDQMSINLINLQASGLQAGDEIGVFDGKLCVGSATIGSDQLMAGSISIRASANDEMSETFDGFTSGHLVKLQFYRGGQTYPLTLTKLEGQDIFDQNASLFAQVSMSESTGISGFDNQISFRCYPNPFSEQIIIEIQSASSNKLEVNIYDMNGRQVRKLYNGQSKNRGTLIWDGRNEGGVRAVPGTYLINANGKIEKVVMKSRK
jgi:pimeloyl-ACP methyl ester carboxylesterase